MSRVLAVEPFYGGSHRAFLDGLIENSRHEFILVTHPHCFWKWRMRGAAMTLAEKAKGLDFKPDLIIASDMLSLAEFKALYRREVPAILYMHENQVSYPTPASDHRDVHFGFTNLTSMLAADVVAWNSNFHMESFFEALPAFIAAMPDQRPARLEDRIRKKSTIIPPGVDLKAIDRAPIERDGGDPIILWNHRWEFDKRPEVFFQAVAELEGKGVDFRLAILGENFQVKPKAFLEAKEKFGDRIVCFGFVEDRDEYVRWLRRSSVSVSVAGQENFGIAAVEAAYAGAAPLWPDRLSYPELIPALAGRGHLYSDFSELVIKLKCAIKAPGVGEAIYADSLRGFGWPEIIGRYDELIEAAAARRSELLTLKAKTDEQ